MKMFSLCLTVILSACLCLVSGSDYYQLLGLQKGSATEKQMKKAYRKMALEFHPVRCGQSARSALHLRAVLQCLTRLPCVQDKAQGTAEEKEAAAKKFADINHGACPVHGLCSAGVQACTVCRT